LEHLLRAIMDISARAFSLADRPRLDHLGHQCSPSHGRCHRAPQDGISDARKAGVIETESNFAR
jgi:hypothetical protein